MQLIIRCWVCVCALSGRGLTCVVAVGTDCVQSLAIRVLSDKAAATAIRVPLPRQQYIQLGSQRLQRAQRSGLGDRWEPGLWWTNGSCRSPWWWLLSTGIISGTS